MFTGLIESVGKIHSLTRMDSGLRVIILSDLSSRLQIGDSIAIDGTCLTVVDKTERSFAVELSMETVGCTIASTYTEATAVNLERSLVVGSRIDGHIVTGHIDSAGTVLSVKRDGQWSEFSFEYPDNFSALVVAKGSIAINGVSLTVNRESGNQFSVVIIPHTAAVTNLVNLKPQASVNLEFDMVGKYVNKALSARVHDVRERSIVKGC